METEVQHIKDTIRSQVEEMFPGIEGFTLGEVRKVLKGGIPRGTVLKRNQGVIVTTLGQEGVTSIALIVNEGETCRIYTPSSEKNKFEIIKQDGRLVIGKDGDVVVPYRYVSRKHCQVGWNGNTLLIEDMKSTNGTGFVKVEFEPVQKTTDDTPTALPAMA